MKKILSIILVLFTVVSFVGCGKNQVGKIVKEDKKETYVNERYGFKFDLPSDWKDKYGFYEAGGTSQGDKDFIKFQVDFEDKDLEERVKENKEREITLRIYVLNKEHVEREAKKEKQDIKTFIEAGNWGTYLGENDESVFTVSFYKSMGMISDEVKELFSKTE